MIETANCIDNLQSEIRSFFEEHSMLIVHGLESTVVFSQKMQRAEHKLHWLSVKESAIITDFLMVRYFLDPVNAYKL